MLALLASLQPLDEALPGGDDDLASLDDIKL